MTKVTFEQAWNIRAAGCASCNGISAAQAARGEIPDGNNAARLIVLIPFKSGHQSGRRGARKRRPARRLNPFQIRASVRTVIGCLQNVQICLNPFQIRASVRTPELAKAITIAWS